MSTQMHRDQVTRLVSELAGLETKLSKARGDAARERSAATRAATSITRTKSASTIQSRLREVERRESRAVALDKEAARLANRIASKQKARGNAEGQLAKAEAADRRKLASEVDRRRRDELRHVGDVEMARRPRPLTIRATLNEQVEADEPSRKTARRRRGRPPWTPDLFWARYRAAAAQANAPFTYAAIAPHFQTLDGNVGTEPEYVRKLVGRFGLPPETMAE